MGVRSSSFVNSEISIEEMKLPSVLLEDGLRMSSPEEGNWGPMEIERGSLYDPGNHCQDNSRLLNCFDQMVQSMDHMTFTCGHAICSCAVRIQSMSAAEDKIHLVVCYPTMFFCAVFRAWILGAVVSCGDVNLDVKSVAGQERFHRTACTMFVCIISTYALAGRLRGKDGHLHS